jgi:DNA-binding LytR/AlgR family response regulator
MLKILILEDEEPAAKRLFKMIKEIEPDVVLLDSLESVTASIKWLQENSLPDLIFSDIQLSDSISFDIFQAVKPDCPVIFTTAYDQYAIDAFKLNSIDYLLKPIKKDELEAAIGKFKKLKSASAPAMDIAKLLESYSNKTQQYKNRFVVRYGEHIKSINTEEIAYFYTEDKVNFITTHEGRRYVTDFNLDQLENLLPPKQFFRINRQYIISFVSIAEMLAYTKGRVLIKLKPASKHETVVSTERSANFKTWLDDGA